MAQRSQCLPNRLPVPGALRLESAQTNVTVSREDLFPKGKITKYFPKNSYGFIRDRRGRELFFHIDELDLVGPLARKQHIRVGADVGYDCCRTSHGLRVKRMKIYN